MNTARPYKTATLLCALAAMTMNSFSSKQVLAENYDINQIAISSDQYSNLIGLNLEGSRHNVTFSNESSLYVHSTKRDSNVFGIKSANDVAINNIAGDICVALNDHKTEYPYSYYEKHRNAVAISGEKNITIEGDINGRVETYACGGNDYLCNTTHAASIQTNSEGSRITLGNITQDALIKTHLYTDHGKGYGIQSAGSIQMGDVAGAISVYTFGSGAGIQAADELVVNDITGNISVENNFDGSACSIYSGKKMTVGNIAGTIYTESEGLSQGLYSGSSLNTGQLTGKIHTRTISGNTALCISSKEDLVIGKDDAVGISGSIKAVAGNIYSSFSGSSPSKAYAISSEGNIKVNGDITGTISAYAAGQTKQETVLNPNPFPIYIPNPLPGGSISIGGSISVVGGCGLEISCGSSSGLSLSTTSDEIFLIGSISVDGTVLTNEYDSSTAGTIDFVHDDNIVVIDGTIIDKVDSAPSCDSIMSTAVAINSTYDAGIISLGNICKNASIVAISEAQNGEAFGIKLASKDDTLDTGAITIGNVEGEIFAVANRNAIAVYSEDSLTFGDISGKIVSASNGSECCSGTLDFPINDIDTNSLSAAIVSKGNLTTGEISGVIQANGKSTAFGICTSGTLNTTISGIISATTLDNNSAKAILSASGNDRVTLKDSALIIGDIDLGSQEENGEDILTLEDYGFIHGNVDGVESLVVNGTNIEIDNFDTLNDQEKEAAIINAVDYKNVWILSQKNNINHALINSGFVEVDGGIAAADHINLASNAGMIF